MATGQTVTVNDIQMYYEVHGIGSPLVLLHWYTGTSQNWQPFIIDLAKHYQLIIPDLRGHGRSTNPTQQFTHRQVAFDIFALLDQLKIDRFKAIGGSSGAEVLLHMATQQSARVEAMALVGAEIYYAEQARTIYRDLAVNSAIWNWEILHQRHVHGDEQIRKLLNQFREFANDYDDMHFTPPHLATITAKTLIVQGDRDEYCPISFAFEMYTSIPNSYLWIVPNGPHLPIHGEHAKLFTRTVLEFLLGKWE